MAPSGGVALALPHPPPRKVVESLRSKQVMRERMAKLKEMKARGGRAGRGEEE